MKARRRFAALIYMLCLLLTATSLTVGATGQTKSKTNSAPTASSQKVIKADTVGKSYYEIYPEKPVIYPNVLRKEPKIPFTEAVYKSLIDADNYSTSQMLAEIVNDPTSDMEAKRYAQAWLDTIDGRKAYDERNFDDASRHLTGALDCDCLTNNSHFYVMSALSITKMAQKNLSDAWDLTARYFLQTGGGGVANNSTVVAYTVRGSISRERYLYDDAISDFRAALEMASQDEVKKQIRDGLLTPAIQKKIKPMLPERH